MNNFICNQNPIFKTFLPPKNFNCLPSRMPPITLWSLFANTFAMIFYKQPIRKIGLNSPKSCGLSFLRVSMRNEASVPLGNLPWPWNSLMAVITFTLITSQHILMKLKLKSFGPGFYLPHNPKSHSLSPPSKRFE